MSCSPQACLLKSNTTSSGPTIFTGSNGELRGDSPWSSSYD